MNSPNFGKKRTLILCNEIDECQQIEKYLTNERIPVHIWAAVSTEMRRRQSISAQTFWSDSNGILVLTDETFNELNIRNAEIVIHFSLPEKYLNFMYRFSSSIDFYENVMVRPKIALT